jgi:D-alanyl-lipoteichoic acid acyltransferase DltB (MBOAT superfamily)
MLFNSGIFLFAFLPVTLAVYYIVLARAGKLASQLWLFAASLFFYGWWNPVYLSLILISMAFNYAVGQRLMEKREKPLLALGVAANLAVLGYYKYTMFFLANLNGIAGTSFVIPHIILPLGISFFTFQKVAFLVDCYRREVPKEQNWINFGLFISFFPQLIAGPIVHHKEMMPQFHRPKGFSAENLAIGLCLLVIGLFKKTIIADGLDAYATPLFELAKTRPLHIVEAWAAMLTYTFQIYFDFSGYSDMALGLGKMFGVRLPVNFFSPYKSENIISFWRRWHMTLSRFLRDYLYIPLGGNRKGPFRRHLNLVATMLLGGFWHGAQWTFLVWGGLHGLYLVINHAWQRQGMTLNLWLSRVITFMAVAVAWVFFRADSLTTAWSVVTSLVHVQDFAGLPLHKALVGPKAPLRKLLGAAMANRLIIVLAFCFVISWLMPNSVEIMRRGKPAISGLRGFFPLPRGRTADILAWRPNMTWGIVFGAALTLCVLKVLYEPSQVFLYFQF